MMIKFFRHIRKSLLMENKTSKPALPAGRYFKYAIGEIVLVVIGILIALQINNWNENRKNQIQINKALKALRYDLVKDSTLISKHFDFSENEDNNIKKILYRVQHKSSTVDTLVKIARYQFKYSWVTPLKYSNSTLATIQSSELFGNLSDSLRLGITDLQNTQVYYMNVLEKNNISYLSKLNNFKENFAISIEGDSLNSLAAALSWNNINTKDFVVKFDDLVEWRYQLWLQYSYMLSRSKLRTDNLIRLVDKNISE